MADRSLEHLICDTDLSDHCAAHRAFRRHRSWDRACALWGTAAAVGGIAAAGDHTILGTQAADGALHRSLAASQEPSCRMAAVRWWRRQCAVPDIPD